MREGARAGTHRSRRPGAPALVLLLALAGCTTGRALLPPSPAAAVPGFTFATDTFAFANEIRARTPDAEYANYCFVLARGLRQFHAFARFDPLAPALDHEGYVARIRAVVSRPPWETPLSAAERVIIPGYADLRSLSAAQAPAVKAALGGRLGTLLHWTNWRVTLPVSDAHQEREAAAVLSEIAAGRLVQLLVTNWPTPELNHTVVAYAFRETAGAAELLVWDPNDPAEPGVITFARGRRRFVATRLHDTEPGPIRVFRMTYGPWL